MRWKSRSKTGRMCIICIILLIFSTGFISLEQYFQPAQTTDNQEPGTQYVTQAKDPNVGGLLVRTFVSLIAVLALLYLGVVGLKKYMMQRNGINKSLYSLKVIGSTFLGPKKAIYLVQAIDRILILGVTDAQVSLLSEITDQETLKIYAPAQPGGHKSAHSTFAQQLATILKGLKKNEG